MRERLGLRPGSKLVFDEQPNGDFVVRKKTGGLAALQGIVKAAPGFAPMLEDFDQATADEIADRDARAR
jgi:bifunctional DNA-binding transcriptional regulator/antitoxin component of YhaV-PrlF toxin-antitoxin module